MRHRFFQFSTFLLLNTTLPINENDPCVTDNMDFTSSRAERNVWRVAGIPDSDFERRSKHRPIMQITIWQNHVTVRLYRCTLVQCTVHVPIFVRSGETVHQSLDYRPLKTSLWLVGVSHSPNSSGIHVTSQQKLKLNKTTAGKASKLFEAIACDRLSVYYNGV